MHAKEFLNHFYMGGTALNLNKSIIAIEPWASERTAQIVKDNADAIVKWQASVVDAIRNYSP
jgi:hypothetical protein